MRAQRLELGGEHKIGAGEAVIERLLAESVARQVQDPLVRVPQREREHAYEARERALDAPAFESGKHDLGVGVAAPAGAALSLSSAARSSRKL